MSQKQEITFRVPWDMRMWFTAQVVDKTWSEARAVAVVRIHNPSEVHEEPPPDWVCTACDVAAMPHGFAQVTATYEAPGGRS